MSWQDVRGWYEERDDEPDPEPVELGECVCWQCGRVFVMPVQESERFCSLECGGRWCEQTAAEMPGAWPDQGEPAGWDDAEIPF